MYYLGHILRFVSYLKGDNTMNENMNQLLDKAKAIHGSENISFCGLKKNWKDCFTAEGNKLILWFNVGKDTKTLAVNL